MGEIRLIESEPLRYLLSVPDRKGDGDGDGDAAPVLCFLHGYDEGAPAEIHAAMTKHGPLRPGSAPAAMRDFIVVAPQLPRMGDHWHRHAGDVLHMVEGVRDEHGGDARRTYLTGFSFGGNGVFDLALLQPGAWAALWPVDPTRVPGEDPGLPVWLSIGGVARRLKHAFVDALRLHPAAGAAPHGPRIWEDEGQDHVGSATHAYRDERIYAWLLGKAIADGGVG
jgi:poly(3-hydroxybutyrate) depolymerase